MLVTIGLCSQCAFLSAASSCRRFRLDHIPTQKQRSNVGNLRALVEHLRVAE